MYPILEKKQLNNHVEEMVILAMGAGKTAARANHEALQKKAA